MKRVVLRLREASAEAQQLDEPRAAAVYLQDGERILRAEGGLVGGHASFVVVTAQEQQINLPDDDADLD